MWIPSLAMSEDYTKILVFLHNAPCLFLLMEQLKKLLSLATGGRYVSGNPKVRKNMCLETQKWDSFPDFITHREKDTHRPLFFCYVSKALAVWRKREILQIGDITCRTIVKSYMNKASNCVHFSGVWYVLNRTEGETNLCSLRLFSDKLYKDSEETISWFLKTCGGFFH